MLADFCSIGFSGHRALNITECKTIFKLARLSIQSWCEVLTGCAKGADAAARAGANGKAKVFRVTNFNKSAFALRSISFINALAESNAPVLCVWPGCKCPNKLYPSKKSQKCFNGFGSGSWSTAALNVGLGLPVIIFGLQKSALPYWGVWSQAPKQLSSGFMLTRTTKQLTLF